jgi:hypothetical protein
MAKYFRSGDSKTLHIVVPGSWKDFLQKRADQNNRALSDEIREALGKLYKLEDNDVHKEIIEPELIRELKKKTAI